MGRAASAVVAILALAWAISPRAQTPARDLPSATGNATIRGRVFAAGTGEPIRKARVTLSGGANLPSLFSDASGNYSFRVPFGSYTLRVHKAGFADALFGAALPTEPPRAIDVTASAPAADGIDVRMQRSGAISGRIVDGFGDPIELAFVSAQRLVRTSDGRVAGVSAASTTTDDLGEYRLGGLAAGSYVVNANQNQFSGVVLLADGVMVQRDSFALQAFFPGVPRLAQAQRIDVRAGDEQSSTDFALAPFQSPAKLTLSFVDARGEPVDANGSISNGFEVRNVDGEQATVPLDEGTWAIYARAGLDVGVGRVTMGGGDESLTIRVVKAAQITGRVTTDRNVYPTLQVALEAEPADAAMRMAAARWSRNIVRPDGVFALSGLLGPLRLGIHRLPPGWVPVAMLHEGRNLLNETVNFKAGEILTDVQVVISNRVATLRGTVIDGGQGPVTDYSVLLFAENRSLLGYEEWRPRWIRPNQRGQFVTSDLVPGSYLAAAVGAVDGSQWNTVAYLDRLRAIATPITLGDREDKPIVLTLARPR